MTIIVAIVAFVAGLIIGEHGGYWRGRTTELFLNAKKYGIIPEDTEFGEWLSKKDQE